MATVGLEITVAELREVTRRLLDSVERTFGPTVPLNADGYWGLFAPDMFEGESKPDLLWRSLADDVHDLRAMLARDDILDDDPNLWHDLNHLVGILERLSSLTG